MQRDGLLSNAVDQLRAYNLPGTTIDQFGANTVIGQVGITPVKQGRKYREKIFATLSEQILVACWPCLIALFMQNAAFYQILQATGQYGGRKPQALLELIKPGQAMKRIAQYQDAPPFSDAVQ